MSDWPAYPHPEQQDALNAAPEPSRLEDFEHDWYIRVKFQYHDLKRADRTAAIAKMESEVVALFDGKLPGRDFNAAMNGYRATFGAGRIQYQAMA